MPRERVALYIAVLRGVFVLCIALGLPQSLESAGDAASAVVPETLNVEPGKENGFEEVYSEGDRDAVYINWEVPATNGSSCAWFLGAYRMVTGHGCSANLIMRTKIQEIG